MADNFLHDDIFSKDMIDSMKAQMVPSDDVINSLLAKISSECSLTGDEAVRMTRRRRNRGTDFRTAYKYIAAVAAAFVMLVGTVSLLGNGDNGTVTGIIESVVDNPTVVTLPKEDPTAANTDNTGDVSQDNENQDKPGEIDSNEPANETKDNTDTAVTTDNTDNKEPAKTKPAKTGGTLKPDDKEASDSGNAESKDKDKEDVNWVKEVLAVEAPQAVFMGESYMQSDATSEISGSDAGNLVFSASDTSADSGLTYKVRTKKIKKVSPNIMVGVMIPDTDSTLFYVNRDYAPSTLGEFLKDSGISGNINFSTVVYTEKITDAAKKTEASNSYSISVSKVGNVMADLVFSQSYAETIGSAFNNREDTFATFISSKSQNPLGLDIKFEVNRNGHLYINLSSGNAFTFYIGEDQTEELLNSIKSTF